MSRLTNAMRLLVSCVIMLTLSGPLLATVSAQEEPPSAVVDTDGGVSEDGESDAVEPDVTPDDPEAVPSGDGTGDIAEEPPVVTDPEGEVEATEVPAGGEEHPVVEPTADATGESSQEPIEEQPPAATEEPASGATDEPIDEEIPAATPDGPTSAPEQLDTSNLVIGAALPVAVTDDIAVGEGALAFPIDVVSNDTDANNDFLFVTQCDQPATGGQVFNNDSTHCIFQSFVGVTGIVSFTYLVSDGTNAVTGTVNVNLQSRDTAPPIAADDTFTRADDFLVQIDVLANDSDPEGEKLYIQSFTQPANGSVICAISDPVTPSLCNVLFWDPNAGFEGFDSFTYVAIDQAGETASATVNVRATTRANNGFPVANNDTVETSIGASSVAFNPLLNDSDPDGDALLLTISNQTDDGNPVTCNRFTGACTIDATNFDGADSMEYVIGDGVSENVATITFVPGANIPPTAEDDHFKTIQDIALAIDAPGVLSNDGDPEGDELVASLQGAPAHGQVTLNPDGSFTYEPENGYIGPDSFVYAVDQVLQQASVQGQRILDTAVVSIDVEAPSPTDEPTEEATEEATAEPTEEPTDEATEEPTEETTEEATEEPTVEPSATAVDDGASDGESDEEGDDDSDTGGVTTLPATGVETPAEGGAGWLAPLAGAIALAAFGIAAMPSRRRQR